MSTRRLALWVVLAATVVTGCGGGDPDDDDSGSSSARLTAEVVQLRRDQALERIEVTVGNRGRQPVVVEQLDVRIPGFRSGPPVAKDSPIPPGLEVNLPWDYGDVTCPADAAPDVGPAVVTLRLREAGRGDPTEVRVRAKDPEGLLQRIAERICTVRRTTAQVDLRFGDSWRLDEVAGQQVLHGTVRARLLEDGPLEISQVAGAVMYGLRPDDTGGQVPDPLAGLRGVGDRATVPVVAYAARCDAHTRGEIKKPYEFLVWVGAPGEEPVAITPTVGDRTKQALRQVCAF